MRSFDCKYSMGRPTAKLLASLIRCLSGPVLCVALGAPMPACQGALVHDGAPVDAGVDVSADGDGVAASLDTLPVLAAPDGAHERDRPAMMPGRSPRTGVVIGLERAKGGSILAGETRLARPNRRRNLALVAESGQAVGQVGIECLGDALVVDIVAAPDWKLAAVYLYASTSPPPADLPPAFFPYVDEPMVRVVESTFEVPLSDLGAACCSALDGVYVVVNARVTMPADPTREVLEAWAGHDGVF